MLNIVREEQNLDFCFYHPLPQLSYTAACLASVKPQIMGLFGQANMSFSIPNWERYYLCNGRKKWLMHTVMLIRLIPFGENTGYSSDWKRSLSGRYLISYSLTSQHSYMFLYYYKEMKIKDFMGTQLLNRAYLGQILISYVSYIHPFKSLISHWLLRVHIRINEATFEIVLYAE